jgi:hypothetical protein
MSETPHRQHHDMGGQPAGPVSTAEHEIEPWEKKIEAILRCMQLRTPALVTVDELRRGIEELPPDQYDKLTYYERWISSLVNILIEKGMLTRAEVDERLAELKAARASEAAE